MSETPEAPEPQIDPAPDAAPGGVDAVVDDPDDLPLVTPDQPQSAQVDDADVPDEIKEPEELDEAQKDVDPGDEDQA